MTDDRLQQIIDYAKALEQAAKYGIGNVKDTADIVKALQELQAYRQLWASVQRERRAA